MFEVLSSILSRLSFFKFFGTNILERERERVILFPLYFHMVSANPKNKCWNQKSSLIYSGLYFANLCVLIIFFFEHRKGDFGCILILLGSQRNFELQMIITFRNGRKCMSVLLLLPISPLHSFKKLFTNYDNGQPQIFYPNGVKIPIYALNMLTVLF